MGLVVQKFGGSSLKDAERVMEAARKAVRAKHAGNQVIVVVSAQGSTTDDLIAKAAEITASPSAREMDMLLATGEQISIALTALAIQELGEKAVSLTGPQIGIVTDSTHRKARIKSIDTRRLREALEAGNVVVLAGFQGVDELGDISTLGPRRERHHRRRRCGRDEARRFRGDVRDLHRRGRRLHDRPAGRARRAQDGRHQLRRDAGDGEHGRGCDALAIDRVRQEVRRAADGAELALRRASAPGSCPKPSG